jgi:ATP-dependent helicase HrpB
MLLAERNGCFADAAVMAAILSERPLVLTAGPKATLRKNVVNALGEQGRDDEQRSDLFALMNALRDAKAANFAPDVCNGLGISGIAARQVLATAKFFVETGRRCGLGKGQSGVHPDALLKAMLAAFPDRLARRRDFGSLVCDLPNGQRGELARESTVRESRLLVAGEVRELAGKGQAAKTLLSLASAVKEEWLRELFPKEWVEQDETVWDERNQQVVRRRRVTCLGLVLEQSTGAPNDGNAAAAILARKVIDGSLRLDGWNDDVDAWIERVRWVGACFAERGLIAYDDTDLEVVYEEICKGATQYRDVRKKPCLDAVRHVLSWDDQQFVEKMAPAHIVLPRGRRVRLRYKPGQAPCGRARVQDLYDLKVNPKVAGGRHTVRLEIQAPNMRTVQVTDDIARFWTEHYPAVKREFSRRYPKHEWR